MFSGLLCGRVTLSLIKNGCCICGCRRYGSGGRTDIQDKEFCSLLVVVGLRVEVGLCRWFSV